MIPSRGDSVLVCDPTKPGEWQKEPRKITEVTHQGIHGWIVEIENGRMIEVKTLANNVYQEITPEERRAKHKGYSP